MTNPTIEEARVFVRNLNCLGHNCLGHNIGANTYCVNCHFYFAMGKHIYYYTGMRWNKYPSGMTCKDFTIMDVLT